MVEYKLVDIDDEGRLVYEYWIENRRNDKGLAALDPETGEAEVTQRAPSGFGWHEGHLLSDLRRKWQSGDKEPERGFVAWY